MTTARNVIRLALQDIDCVIKMMEAANANANAEAEKKRDEKRSAMASGMDYLKACEQFDHSIGFNTGIAIETEDRLEMLKSMRNHYVSLNKIYAEEAEQEEEGNE